MLNDLDNLMNVWRLELTSNLARYGPPAASAIVALQQKLASMAPNQHSLEGLGFSMPSIGTFDFTSGLTQSLDFSDFTAMIFPSMSVEAYVPSINPIANLLSQLEVLKFEAQT
jgi:hypothetical protein